MSNVYINHPISGHVSITVNGVTHAARIEEKEPFADAIILARQRGNNPAEALRYLAVIGIHVWHPGRSPAKDLLSRWAMFFGGPSTIPNGNGSLLGKVVVRVHNQQFEAEIRGGDFYDTQILRAFARGEHTAYAFKFLAEVGVRLHKANYTMLGNGEQSELRRFIGQYQNHP